MVKGGQDGMTTFLAVSLELIGAKLGEAPFDRHLARIDAFLFQTLIHQEKFY